MARSRLVWLVGAAAALAAQPRAARACSVSQMPAVIDPSLAAVDKTPPTLPPIPPPAITRGHGPQNEGCSGSTASSCDDIGTILFTVAGTDDMTPAARLGYAFSLASGTLPDGFTLPPTPLAPQTATLISLDWVDGAIDGQDPIAFSLRIVAVDGAGNQSAPRIVDVRQGSSGDCGVAAPGRPRATALLVVAAAVVLAARRRSRRA